MQVVSGYSKAMESVRNVASLRMALASFTAIGRIVSQSRSNLGLNDKSLTCGAISTWKCSGRIQSKAKSMSYNCNNTQVCAVMCATCPFRPGSKYADLAPMLAKSALTEASRICHSTEATTPSIGGRVSPQRSVVERATCKSNSSTMQDISPRRPTQHGKRNARN